MIRNPLTNTCLTSNSRGQDISLTPCDKNNNKQLWRLHNDYIRSEYDPDGCIDQVDNPIIPGQTRPKLWTCNSTDSQRFKYQDNGITCGGYNLDIFDSKSPQLTFWKNNSTPNQIWKYDQVSNNQSNEVKRVRVPPPPPSMSPSQNQNINRSSSSLNISYPKLQSSTQQLPTLQKNMSNTQISEPISVTVPSFIPPAIRKNNNSNNSKIGSLGVHGSMLIPAPLTGSRNHPNKFDKPHMGYIPKILPSRIPQSPTSPSSPTSPRQIRTPQPPLGPPPLAAATMETLRRLQTSQNEQNSSYDSDDNIYNEWTTPQTVSPSLRHTQMDNSTYSAITPALTLSQNHNGWRAAKPNL